MLHQCKTFCTCSLSLCVYINIHIGILYMHTYTVRGTDRKSRGKTESAQIILHQCNICLKFFMITLIIYNYTNGNTFKERILKRSHVSFFSCSQQGSMDIMEHFKTTEQNREKKLTCKGYLANTGQSDLEIATENL